MCLSKRINWQRLEANIDTVYSEGGGQPPLPTRLLVGLHYLKYAFDESDESVVQCWVENPYDHDHLSPIGQAGGHTLDSALAHANQLSNTIAKHVCCDKGYRGHKQNGKGKPNVHLDGRIPKTATRTEKAWRKRRVAIEPTIGHLKSDNRMGRNFLKGREGNKINPILAAVAYNFRKLLAWFSFVLRVFILRSASYA